MQNTFLFIFLILVLLSSCGPKQPEQQPCKEIKEATKDFLDYWFFPSGSWWVYKLDSAVDIYDTVRGSSEATSNPGTRGYNHSLPPCFMQYGQYLTHSDTLLFTYQRRGNELITASEWLYTIYYKDGDFWDLIHGGSFNIHEYGIIYKHPSTIGEEYYGGAGRNYFNGIDTFSSPFLGKLDSTIYLTTGVTAEVTEVSKTKYFKKLYIAKGIGVVKIEYTNGESWELIDYKINK